MYKILVIEDNLKLCNELCYLLKKYGYEVYRIDDFDYVFEEYKLKRPDIILLDINLPSFDGYHFCRKIREISNVPIIFLTSRNNTADEVMAMTMGGDDYITKPYDNQVLLSRISAVLKRSYGITQMSETISTDGIKLYTASNILEYKDKKVELTKNEQRLLAVLLKSKGSIVSRGRLIETLWDNDDFVDENTLSVNITRLRSKLTDIGLNDIISTIRGQGYIIK
ncbi:response regulator transcription factor [Mycoplasmatota bacterium]|nr:response regulator transcription factor [Mycoplasmatota bacterium]